MPYARPELKERLKQLHGSSSGYREWALDMAAVAGAKRVSSVFLDKLFRHERNTPESLVVALTRVAEEDYTMDRDVAYALSHKWFTTVKEVPAHDGQCTDAHA